MDLSASGTRTRVPDAIASAALAYVSLVESGTASDIPQDFSITNTIDIVVPTDAMYLFTGVDYIQAVNRPLA